MSIEARVIELAGMFKLNNTRYESLHGFHNLVYLIGNKPDFILRLTPTNHRNKEAVLSEIDFMLFLKEKGVSLSAPICGLDGKYAYDIIDGDDEYIAAAFEVAAGRDFKSRPTDDDLILKEAGRMLGRLHKYSKIYKPRNLSMRRKWNESQHLMNAEGIFERSYPELKSKYNEYINKMNSLPEDADGYGLIHGDYLFSNYFFDDKNITIIDFDECEYSWFIYDIAVCMYYYLLGGDPSELSGKAREAENLFYSLYSGYAEENKLDIFWIANIDLFFKTRDYVLLSTMGSIPYDELNGWGRSFVDGALDRQLNDKPFIQADFVKIYNRVNGL